MSYKVVDRIFPTKRGIEGRIKRTTDGKSDWYLIPDGIGTIAFQLTVTNATANIEVTTEPRDVVLNDDGAGNSTYEGVEVTLQTDNLFESDQQNVTYSGKMIAPTAFRLQKVSGSGSVILTFRGL